VNSVEAVLLLARSQLWVRERGGDNRGEVVEQYLRTVHLGASEPWCAAFVSWVDSQAVTQWPLPLTASCQALYEAGAKKQFVQNWAVPGSVFVLWRPRLQRFAHTGFIVAQAGNGWATIEGNTNPDGGREGYGVFARTRTFAPEDRFLHWLTGVS